MSLQQFTTQLTPQFTTQLTPPLRRLICEYMGRGFIGIVCPEYFETLYEVTDEKCRQHKLASEMIGREGDVLSCTMIPHDVDVEYVARGAAAVDSTDLIGFLMTNIGRASVYNGLMWGYTSAKNYGGFQHTYKIMAGNFGGLWMGLWTYDGVLNAIAGALIHIETDSGALADKVNTETGFLISHTPLRIIQAMRRDVKKYSPLVVDWITMKLTDFDKKDTLLLLALDDLKDAIAS